VCLGRALTDGETLEKLQQATPNDRVTLHVMLEAAQQAAGPSSPVKSAGHSSAPCTPTRRPPASAHRSAPCSPSHAPCGGTQSPTADPSFLEKLKRQVESNMKRAFFDLIETALSSTPPDHEWIARLYAEMRDKLCSLTPNRPDLRAQVQQNLDVAAFADMVRHEAFEAADLRNLVSFVFGRLASLCAPARDRDVQQRRSDLEALLAQPGTTFARFAVAFLKSFHTTMEEVEADVEAFKSGSRARPPPAAGDDDEGVPVATSAAASSAAALSPEGGVQELKDRLLQLGVDSAR